MVKRVSKTTADDDGSVKEEGNSKGGSSKEQEQGESVISLVSDTSDDEIKTQLSATANTDSITAVAVVPAATAAASMIESIMYDQGRDGGKRLD